VEVLVSLMVGQGGLKCQREQANNLGEKNRKGTAPEPQKEKRGKK